MSPLQPTLRDLLATSEKLIPQFEQLLTEVQTAFKQGTTESLELAAQCCRDSEFEILHQKDDAFIAARRGNASGSVGGALVCIPDKSADENPFAALPFSIGLGVVLLLESLADGQLPSVKILFHAGGTALNSASLPISSIVEFDDVDAVFGYTLERMLAPGELGVAIGPDFPAADDYEFRIARQRVETRNNVIQLAAHVITSLSQLASRTVDPLTPARLDFYSISSETDASKIPRAVRLQALCQSMDENTLRQLRQLINESLQATAQAYDFQMEAEIVTSYAATGAAAEPRSRLLSSMRDIVGKVHIHELEFVTQAPSFLAPFLRMYPGAVLRIGCNTGMSAAEQRSQTDAVRLIALSARTLAWALLTGSSLPSFSS